MQALARIGITAQVQILDSAAYQERTNTYDFDMTYYQRGLSLSPGNEQYNYWGRAGVKTPGSRNWAGIDSAAAEAMIDAILTSATRDDFVAATRALDRVLTSGRYVIPFYQNTVSRLAHAKELHAPERIPVYGDWIVWQSETWWMLDD